MSGSHHNCHKRCDFKPIPRFIRNYIIADRPPSAGELAALPRLPRWLYGVRLPGRGAELGREGKKKDTEKGNGWDRKTDGDKRRRRQGTRRFAP